MEWSAIDSINIFKPITSILTTRGLKNAPTQLNVNEVKVGIDAGQGGWSHATFNYSQFTVNTLNTGDNLFIAGPSLATPDAIDTANKTTRLMGLDVTIQNNVALDGNFGWELRLCLAKNKGVSPFDNYATISKHIAFNNDSKRSHLPFFGSGAQYINGTNQPPKWLVTQEPHTDYIPPNWWLGIYVQGTSVPASINNVITVRTTYLQVVAGAELPK